MGDAAAGFVFVSRTRAERSRVPTLVDVTLDPSQSAAIALPPDRALLVLGEAGHGKTTVLLHRVAALWRERGHGARGAVLVPTEGLVRLVQPLLRRLGIDVHAWTFDHFAQQQARRAFRRLPPESEMTPSSVMKLKRAGALRTAIDVIAAREPGVIDDDRDHRVTLRTHAGRGDLQHLFGDRQLVESVARATGLGKHVVDDVLERTRIQFTRTTEREWAHVTDRQRLVAIDHRAIDDGTATGNAWTIDVEDYAVLFEIDRLRAERRGASPTTPGAFDWIAVDEAQELAPLELALIGRSLAPGAGLVVSGDADQHTDETTSFVGWDAAMGVLGIADYTRTRLDIGYRCPPEVEALARAVRDDTTAASAPIQLFRDEAGLVGALGPALEALLRRDRRASIAVICRHPLTARRIADSLRHLVPTRLVFDGRFLARGPVQVSLPGEVKGLEFDYVVVPDATVHEWPDDRASRRAMYVAITRARQQVSFACTGTPTRIVPRRGP